MGQIRKRGSVWWIRYYQRGQLKEESARTSSYEVARDLLRDREGTICKGKTVTPRMGRTTIGDGLDDLQTEYKVKHRKSAGNLKTRIEKHLLPYFGKDRRMADITAADTMRYTAHRQEEGAADGTINRELAVLKRAFRLAVKGKKVAERPEIEMLPEHNVRKGFVEHDEYLTLYTHLPEPLQPIVLMAYYSSWRTNSEILTLQWRQVDRKAGIITLDAGTTKNNEARTWDYSAIPAVKTMIDQQWTAHEALGEKKLKCPWVFHRAGKQIKNFRHAWQAACKRAGRPGLLVHDLRRSGIRRMIRAGIDESTAMKISGHKTREVFDRYNIQSGEDIRDAGRKLAALDALPMAQAK